VIPKGSPQKKSRLKTRSAAYQAGRRSSVPDFRQTTLIYKKAQRIGQTSRGSRTSFRRSDRRAPIPAQTSRPYLQIDSRRPRTTTRFERGYWENAQTIPVRLDPHHTARTDSWSLCSRAPSSAPVLRVITMRRATGLKLETMAI